ncbi:hypothetical protein QTP88_010631 [Uroleucon formosanum]
MDESAFKPYENLKNKRKRKIESEKRLSGKEYETVKRKTKISGKKAPSNEVICKCKFGCNDVLHMKKKLFEDFYKLGINEQRSYLMGLMHILPIQRRRHGNYDDPVESRRQSTISFTVPDGDGDLKRVCKKTFLDIFAISPQKVTTLVKRKKAGFNTFKDKRGGVKTFKYTLKDRQMVKNHINSFPRDESHYSRAKSEKEYLSPDLNMNRIYLAYKVKNPETTISYKFFRSVFLKDFPKLLFKRPRVDTCKTCDALDLKRKDNNVLVASSGKTELELHHRKVDAVTEVIKVDAAKSTLPGSQTCTITMDLQKVYPLPKLSHTSMYYSRQLSCFNFGIHVTDTSNGIMCVWHEGQSWRGGNQIASCLMQAINSGHLSSYKRHLTVWSDNCAGQLKNRMLLFLYIWLVANGTFDTIEHNFFISGHSYSASDRDFATIEKRAKRSKLFNVNDVKRIIRSSRLDRPFKVIDMGKKTFFDFDTASAKFLDTSKLGISKVVWLKVTKDSPGIVYFKNNFSSLLPFQTCNIFKRGIQIENLINAEIESLPGVVPLKETKKKDLQAMLQYLSEENRLYFEKILSA